MTIEQLNKEGAMNTPVYYWNSETQRIEVWVEPKRRTIEYQNGQIVIRPKK